MLEAGERLTGRIKWYNDGKGYGFVTTDADYRDIFMHINDWVETGEPRKGERVSFIEAVGRGGKPYARQVVVLRGEAE
jgi:CspA family cold shock protein